MLSARTPPLGAGGLLMASAASWLVKTWGGLS
jgi:hypothetical protein